MDPVTQFQLVAPWVVLTIVTAVVVFFIIRVAYLAIKKDLFFDITRKHFPVVVGLPIACLAALFIVLISDNLFGPIEFEAPGFKFKGASGPVVFWMLCLITIAGTIHWLWKCTIEEPMAASLCAECKNKVVHKSHGEV